MTPLRWRGWLVLTAVLLAGIGVGVTGTLVVGTRLVRQALFAPAGGRGQGDRAVERIARELDERLHLTPEESRRVRGLLEESAVELKGIRMRAAREAGLELRRANQRILAELPPEKRAEYQQLIRRRYERLGLGSGNEPAAPPAGAPSADPAGAPARGGR
ncbi:hypothetical protein [Opitutus sp. ER46]|uniref:hypothetical protein n=1 Tax=Opitutus sp. ER46 TaxID=2161864 RepID=UPI000D2FADA9|nr:hypothetical protein [Opitutus sp. ER46]PTX91698.1 hypothetical protein DB354_17690 [Opitutus sp. ER46]